MKKITLFICLMSVSLIWGNNTRMAVLGAGDYIDDIVNSAIYPQQLVMYKNQLYGDITSSTSDFGFIIAPVPRYGCLGLWQAGLEEDYFTIGYGLSLFQFRLGFFFVPVEDQLQYGFGIGRYYFNRGFDLSFLINDQTDDEWYNLNLRLFKQKDDFVIVPRYKLHYYKEPFDYQQHRIGLMIQRYVLNEGFVFVGGEYDFCRGDIENDSTNFYAGLDLPLNRRFVLLLGFNENFINGFESPHWNIEAGIGLRIREFHIDFKLNRERFFNKDLTFISGVGIDLNFGQF